MGLFLSILSGVLTALAFPKPGLFYLAWISLVPLFFVLARSKPRQAFRFAFLAGFVFNAVLLYWISLVPAHYGDMSIGFSIVIYLFFMAFLALFWAFFGWTFVRMKMAFPTMAFIAAPFLWTAFEYGLTHVLTGFPWGLLGNSQYKDLLFIQMVSITGVYGLGFVLVFVQSTFVLAVRKGRKIPFIAALGLLAAVHAAGGLSLGKIAPTRDSFKAAVVQGNTSSDIFWGALPAEDVLDFFEGHMDLTRQAVKEGARLVIWPEFSVPLCFSCPEPLYGIMKDRLTRFSSENDSTFLLGTMETGGSPDNPLFYNTALCLHPDGTTTNYSKIHLVPFGEYTPFKKVFFFIEKMTRVITHSIGDNTPGQNIVLQKFEGLSFGTPICYEIIFPDLVRRFTAQGADFLVTITNDGWYGRTSAPYQHFGNAVLRAVENRRFLLRAATTGVSGIVDPYGRIVAATPIMTATQTSGLITPIKKTTFYTRHGDWFALAALTLSGIFFIMCLIINLRERDRHARQRKKY